ncbi:MAG: alpha-D-ribose 1-methylphosphonate 5-triphosphate diphosphatase [Treponema sp.]|jgi:alpha-D-ribose 1-methylphosphonate 5-triphosphate diphosphatase|nr:alpha-D-ribose 1-methylphosphonate 5-triphosphate diphosphatase [Treponema sp.]
MKECILNAVVAAPDKLLPDHAVVIQGDRILSVIPMSSLGPERGMRCYDACGGYVLPGFIDIHSDYIEGILQPRPTALMDFETGLREAEKHLLGHGVSTIYHSLSIMNVAGSTGRRGGFRTKENFGRLAHLIQHFHRHLIRHRLHVRYDIYAGDLYSYVKGILEEGKVHELSFMDHTPGQGQYRDIATYARSTAGWDVEGNPSLEEKLALLQTRTLVSRKKLKVLAELATKQGAALASHDDDSPEKVLFMKNEYGMRISEFPVDLASAKTARAEGLMVVLGAPNVLLGGSHSGNLSALEAIREGCADILCSDYYPASLLHAAFVLEEKGIVPLAQAVRMLTLNPARAVGIAADYGSVEEGKKADLLIVRKLRSRPLIQRCFIDGQSVLRYHYSGVT